MSHHVTGRRRELALRVALGASPGRLQAAVLGETALVVLAGVACGLALVVPALATLRGWVDLASPRGAMPYLAATATLLAVALLAGLSPARRAAQADPATMLKAD